MRSFVRLAAIVLAVALSGACSSRSSHAGTAALPTAKNCFFLRNKLSCPCPRAEQARVVARAARVTVGAVGTAIGATLGALSRADHGGHSDRLAPAPQAARPESKPPRVR